MKKLDPIERALDAYFELDDMQRRTFHATIVHVQRERERYVGTTAEIVPNTPKRKRPVGSKNRKVTLSEPASPLSPEGFDATALFAGNGAPTEGL